MEISAGWLFSCLLVSSIGFALFRYGKKQARIPHLMAGIALMVGSGFVGDVWWMLVGTGVVLGALWFATRAGR
jgi:hypothetical protein